MSGREESKKYSHRDVVRRLPRYTYSLSRWTTYVWVRVLLTEPPLLAGSLPSFIALARAHTHTHTLFFRFFPLFIFLNKPSAMFTQSYVTSSHCTHDRVVG
jgi:hypothetical protein